MALSLDAMKSTPRSMVIPDDIAAKCDGPDQFENSDRGIRAFLAVPNSAVLKEEGTRARKRAKKLA